MHATSVLMVKAAIESKARNLKWVIFVYIKYSDSAQIRKYTKDRGGSPEEVTFHLSLNGCEEFFGRRE